MNMGFLIARISGGAFGVVLALAAFILQLLIRRKNLPALWIRIIAAAGAAGGVFLFAATLRNVLRYAPGISSLITVSVPLLGYALALIVHFVLIFSSAGRPKALRVLSSTLAAALILTLQLGLSLFNLLRNWNNLNRGMKEFLYIQLLALVFIVLSALLFWINFGKARKFAAS
ncbi:MAG: hypothetical protein LBQ44_09835 [Treponema sp.]|jgi:hypothetical protein|nr:hypothetical protein [Treponema sp.]